MRQTGVVATGNLSVREAEVGFPGVSWPATLARTGVLRVTQLVNKVRSAEEKLDIHMHAWVTHTHSLLSNDSSSLLSGKAVNPLGSGTWLDKAGLLGAGLEVSYPVPTLCMLSAS